MSPPVKNIYYMLSYAFYSLNFNEYKKVASEEFENIYELFSELLIIALNKQIKQGLYRDYIEVDETTSSIRGKINITESINELSFINKKLNCTYDEFSINSYLNKIIKTTLNILLKAPINDKNKVGHTIEELVASKYRDLSDVLAKMDAILALENIDKERSNICTRRTKCPYFDTCFPTTNADTSIMNLVSCATKFKLLDEGKHDISMLEMEDVEGTRHQFAQIVAAKTNKLVFDTYAVENFFKNEGIDELKYYNEVYLDLKRHSREILEIINIFKNDFQILLDGGKIDIDDKFLKTSAFSKQIKNTDKFIEAGNFFDSMLKDLDEVKGLTEDSQSNGFSVSTYDLEFDNDALKLFLKNNGIIFLFHYIKCLRKRRHTCLHR